MRIITLGVYFLITGCGLLSHESICDQYGEELGARGAEMCVSTIKENADEAQARWSKRAEADVQKDVRKEP